VTNVNINTVNIDNEATVQDFIRTVKNKWEIVSLFDTRNKDIKINELKNQVNQVIQLYIQKIQSSHDITGVGIIYQSYVRNVENAV